MSARPTTHVTRVTLAAAAFALALAACGGGTTEPATGDPGPGMAMCAPDVPDCVDTPISDDPGEGDRLMAPDIHVVEALPEGTIFPEQSRADAFNPLFLRQATVDGATVHVNFSGGEAPCFWVSHVDVVETADAVTITVYAGGESGDGCDVQPISDQAVTVTLDAPLGDRALLDGSRTAPAGANT